MKWWEDEEWWEDEVVGGWSGGRMNSVERCRVVGG